MKKHKDGCVIAQVTFSKDQLQEIVDKKVKEYELDIQAIRNKAIDEFLRKICEKYTEEERKGNYKQYCCNIKQELADIAEQMK